MKIFSHPSRLLKLARLTPQQRVLELGCGAGRVLVPAAQLLSPNTVYGIDFQKSMLNLLVKKSRRLHVNNIELLQGDIRTMTLPEQCFDRILMITVLGEIPQQGVVIKRLRSLLSQDGLISVTEVLPDPCYIPAKRMKSLFAQHGLKVVDEDHNLVSYTINFKKT